jgi:hypothetical protein
MIKSVFSVSTINILGFTVGDGVLKPDAERLRPLLDLPAPQDARSMMRVLGMFDHYSQWIPRFSERIRPLTLCKEFQNIGVIR